MAQKAKVCVTFTGPRPRGKFRMCPESQGKCTESSHRYTASVPTSRRDEEKHVVFHAAGDNPQRRALDQPRTSQLVTHVCIQSRINIKIKLMESTEVKDATPPLPPPASLLLCYNHPQRICLIKDMMMVISSLICICEGVHSCWNGTFQPRSLCRGAVIYCSAFCRRAGALRWRRLPGVQLPTVCCLTGFQSLTVAYFSPV